jgi:hypothetical protein
MRILLADIGFRVRCNEYDRRKPWVRSFFCNSIPLTPGICTSHTGARTVAGGAGINFIEADFETHAEERRRFAILKVPRRLFSEATVGSATTRPFRSPSARKSRCHAHILRPVRGGSFRIGPLSPCQTPGPTTFAQVEPVRRTVRDPVADLISVPSICGASRDLRWSVP